MPHSSRHLDQHTTGHYWLQAGVSLLIVFLAFSMMSCKSAGQARDLVTGLAKDVVGKVAGVCPGLSLQDLRDLSIAEVCREELIQKLPEFKTNLINRVLPAGVDRDPQTGKLSVRLLGSGPDGLHLDIQSFSQFEVSVTVNGQRQVLQPHQFSIQSIRQSSQQASQRVQARSVFVQDLMTTVRTGDLDALDGMYRDLLDSMPAEYEASVVAARSDWQSMQTQFSSDPSQIRDQLLDPLLRASLDKRDLVAGIRGALEQLQSQSAEMKFLILSTDSWEDLRSHQHWNELRQSIQASGATVMVIGSGLSDLKSLDEVTSEFEGTFVYSRDFATLQNQFSELGSSLQNAVQIEIESAWSEGVSALELTTEAGVQSIDL